MKNTTTYSIPLFPLFLIFLVLKLCNVITWSWWWVTAPIWIPMVISAGILLFLFVIWAIGAATKR